MRIWGTYPPQKNYTRNISKDVAIQHWEFFEDNPLFDYIDKGYNVINSDDHCYIVNKYSTSYPQHLNRTLIFYGNPLGGAFAPNIFDPNNATNNPPKDNPKVMGHLAAQWNDYGYNTSTYLEAYHSWRNLLPALADKQWGGDLQDCDYDDLFAALQPAAPGQNLDRDVASKSDLILRYIFTPKPRPWGWDQSDVVKDLSGNHYNGKTNCSVVEGALQFASGCSVTTPLTSKGRDYTLSFTMKQTSSTPGPLFRGPDSELWSGNGTSSKVMLISAGNAFPLNYSLPVGEWVDASLIGQGNRTFFSVDGRRDLEFTGKIGVNGEFFEWVTMAVVAPLQTIGGGSWDGMMKGVKLVDYA
jgi:hexosaminidase